MSLRLALKNRFFLFTPLSVQTVLVISNAKFLLLLSCHLCEKLLSLYKKKFC